MTSVPANISRVPNSLAAQMFLANIARTNLGLLNVQTQMATGRTVNRVSDDAIKSAAISALQDRLETAQQRLNNLDIAGTVVDLLDSSVGDASALVLEAKSIAMSQIGITSDPATRANQATVIDSMIAQVAELVNRQTNGVYLFGGSTGSRRPLESVGLGYRYVGRGSGLTTDLGLGERIPINVGAENALGETAARRNAAVDLDPVLTTQTALRDVRGVRGLGVTLGVVSFSFDGGPSAEVDLSQADTAGDVAAALGAAIAQYETTNGVTILGPGGVSIGASGISIDVVSGSPGPDPRLSFSDIGTGTCAADLGLSQTAFEATSAAGGDLDPKLTWLTPLTAISGLTLPLGSVRARFARGGSSQLADIDLSSATTLADVRNAIGAGAPGARLELSSDGRGLSVVNEVSGPGLSIEEVPGGTTATQLGIRTGTPQTVIGELNDGRGVRIVDGVTDPITGAADPARNVDFVIKLAGGQQVAVDLRPSDLSTMKGVIDRINAAISAAETAGDIPVGAVVATFADGPNALALRDLAGAGPITVEKRNNSAAAQDLGLLNGSWDTASATLVARDVSAVRVNGLLTRLMDLRSALQRDDSDGIALAAEGLESSVDALASARALAGVYANRLSQAKARQEDQITFDETVRSQLQDLDFAEASVRFSQLQTQLQAGLQTAAQAQSRTLLDFLG
jgi:flagellin-like hook-associated protein FlgL